MPRSERAQWARMDIDGTALLADLASPLSLARAIEFEGPRLHCFGAAAATSLPLIAGTFSGSVEGGASCNCSVITLTPHANGTHTEGVGHLTLDKVDVHRLVPRRLLPTALVTVEPELAGDCAESTQPAPRDDDRLITRAALARGWPSAPAPALRARALVVRSLPNEPARFVDGARAPFLSREAAEWLVERGIEHLVLDVPSADCTEDAGLLTAHRIFFGMPPDGTRVGQARRGDCTLTELALVGDEIVDGWYLLSLQVPAIAGDAVPSRPLLYALRLA